MFSVLFRFGYTLLIKSLESFLVTLYFNVSLLHMLHVLTIIITINDA